MPFYKTLNFFLFFLLYGTLAGAQNYPSKHYTAATKLPNNAVRSLLIDSNNILWIGTENGVVKKENDVFAYFFEEDGLALNSCWAIEEDIEQKLWFGSYGEGVSIYDGHKFEVISEEDGLVHNEITQLFSSGGLMYVGTSNGFSIIDVHDLKVLSSHTIPGVQLFRILKFLEYRNEIYVLSYNSGIFKIEVNDNQTSLVKVNNHRYIYSVFVDNDSIYSSNKGFFTKSPLADYFNEVDTLASEKFGTSVIWDYIKTSDHKIFAAAWGIYDANGGIYELKDNQLISRASEFNLSSKEVLALAYDPHFEKLYAGTKDAGLFEIALDPQIKFNSADGRKVLGFATAANSTAVLMDEAILINGAENDQSIPLLQLKKWQENYLEYTQLPLPKHEDDFYELDYTIKAEEIQFYDIKAVDTRYWITTNIGIFALNERGELHRYLPLHSQEINFTPTGKLIETNPYGGVRIYSDLDAFEYTHFKQEAFNTPTMVVNSLQRGSKTYFLSIFSGLYVWENQGFTSYLNQGIWTEKKLKHISPLGEDLAISNEFGDIFIVNDAASFEILEKIPRAKFHGNSISFLKEYQGTLLIGTEKGLTLYKNDRFIFLDNEQGLEQPLWDAEVRRDSVYIGSNNGYYVMDPKAVTTSENLVTQLKIEDVFINNNIFSLVDFEDKQKLNLEHNENTVLLKFGTNPHPYPNKLSYQYRLNAGDTWSRPSSSSEIFLPFLPTDEYQVDVKVLDQSTGLSYVQPLLNLSILPPFWKTWWFVLLVLSSLLLGVYGIYKYQIRQHQKFEAQKGSILKRLEETKMEALLAQMNPHFIFNAMNSIQYYMVHKDMDNASIFLGEFAKLIRLNLDHCTKPTLLVVEEIEYLESYIRVENARFDNAIQVSIETDPLIDPYDLEIPTMLLQTFVENVFVHAFPPSIPDPILKVSFKLLSEDLLQCKIEDNGIGISDSTSKLHVSKGITLVRERLSLLGYDVEKAVSIVSSQNKGTSVILVLQV